LAEKSTQLVVSALRRCVAEPEPAPLHGTRTTPGLFAATPSARQAAQRSLEEGYLRVVHTETRGKTSQELCSLTDKGLSWLLQHASARQVLEDFIRAIEAREQQLGRIQAGLDVLRSNADRVLQHLLQQEQSAAAARSSTREAAAWEQIAISYLRGRQESAAGGDCPLPELYRHLQASVPGLSIGQFHDGLRRLLEQQQIYLHPWTGPLYALPEPPCALLVGHEVAYYASLREQ
jgi:hypothetical protein